MNKLVLVSMVKNESDIIESFVRHHLNVVDEIIIVDHNSCDSTKQILECLIAEGLPIHISTDYRVEQAQSEIMTDLVYRAINEYNADIVIPLDADEFLINTQTKEDCRTILQNLDSMSIYFIDSMNSIPTFDETEKFILWRSCLKSKATQKSSKIFIGRKVANRYHIALKQGNHDILISHRKKKLINFSHCQQLQLAHFPVRSKEHFMSKMLSGWIANAARPNKNPQDACHWKFVFDKIIHEKTLSEDEIIKVTSDLYIGDDLEIASLKDYCQYVPIKYADLISMNPFINLLCLSEALALDYAHIKSRENNLLFLFKAVIKSIIHSFKYTYFRKIKGVATVTK